MKWSRSAYFDTGSPEYASYVKCLCWSLGHAEQLLFSCLCSKVAVYLWIGSQLKMLLICNDYYLPVLVPMMESNTSVGWIIFFSLVSLASFSFSLSFFSKSSFHLVLGSLKNTILYLLFRYSVSQKKIASSETTHL